MRKRQIIASLSLFLLMSGGAALAETDSCRSGCETEEIDCNTRASNLPNDVERDDALKVCESNRPVCYDRCEKEKELKEQQEKELKEQQEKELKEKKIDEKSPFILPQNL